MNNLNQHPIRPDSISRYTVSVSEIQSPIPNPNPNLCRQVLVCTTQWEKVSLVPELLTISPDLGLIVVKNASGFLITQNNQSRRKCHVQNCFPHSAAFNCVTEILSAAVA